MEKLLEMIEPYLHKLEDEKLRTLEIHSSKLPDVDYKDKTLREELFYYSQGKKVITTVGISDGGNNPNVDIVVFQCEYSSSKYSDTYGIEIEFVHIIVDQTSDISWKILYMLIISHYLMSIPSRKTSTYIKTIESFKRIRDNLTPEEAIIFEVDVDHNELFKENSDDF